MTAKNSGAHLVIELSSDLISHLLHRISLSQLGFDVKELFARALFPSPEVSFSISEAAEGQAYITASFSDGSEQSFALGIPLSNLLKKVISLELCRITEAQNSPSPCSQGDSFQDLLNNMQLLEDGAFAPLSLHDALRMIGSDYSFDLDEFILPSSGVTIEEIEIVPIVYEGQSTGVAIGIFFNDTRTFEFAPGIRPYPSSFNDQNINHFRSKFRTDFLQSRDIAISVSPTILNRLVFSHPVVLDFIRNAFEEEFKSFAFSGPPYVRFTRTGILLLYVNGDVLTEDDCDLDLNLVANIFPLFEGWNLKARIHYDPGIGFFDILPCIIDDILIGALIGGVIGGIVGATVGAISGAWAAASGFKGDATIKPCGDDCLELKVKGPIEFSSDFGVNARLDYIFLDPTSITLGFPVEVSVPKVELRIDTLSPRLYPNPYSFCNQEGSIELVPAKFELINPNPFEPVFYERPYIRSIILSENLKDFLEIVVEERLPEPYEINSSEVLEFRLPDSRRELTIQQKDGVTPRDEVGYFEVWTNAAPYRRRINVEVFASHSGEITITPSDLSFEQLQGVTVDLDSLASYISDCIHRGPIRIENSIGGRFEIRNYGTSPLIICDLRITADAEQVFKFAVEPTPIILLPGTVASYHVVLNNAAVFDREYSSILEIESSDPNRPVATLSVTGKRVNEKIETIIGGRNLQFDRLTGRGCIELIGDEIISNGLPIDYFDQFFPCLLKDIPQHMQELCDLIFNFKLTNGLEGMTMDIISESGPYARGTITPGLDVVDVWAKNDNLKEIKFSGLDRFKFGLQNPTLQIRAFGMVPLSTFQSDQQILDVELFKGSLVVSTGTGLEFLDIEDPTRPKKAGAFVSKSFQKIFTESDQLLGFREDGLYLLQTNPKGIVQREKVLIKSSSGRMLDFMSLGQDCIHYVLLENTIEVFDLSNLENVVKVCAIPIRDHDVIAIDKSLNGGFFTIAQNHLIFYENSRFWAPERSFGFKISEKGKSIRHPGMSANRIGPKIQVVTKQSTTHYLQNEQTLVKSVEYFKRRFWMDDLLNCVGSPYFVRLSSDLKSFDLVKLSRLVPIKPKDRKELP